MDQHSFGAVVRLLAVASMFVTVISNYWRHGDIDLTGRFANMRTLYGRSMLIGVIVAAVARINVISMLRSGGAFNSYLSSVNGVDLIDDVVGVLITGAVLALLAKLWNDLFDILYEVKRWLRGKANQLRPDDMPRSMREPRESREPREMRRGRRGGRGGRDRDGDRDRYRDREPRRPEPPREPPNGNP